MTYEKHGLYIDEAHLEAFAENYARSVHPDTAVSGRVCAAQLRRSLRRLEAQHDALALKWADIASMPGSVRWLLDNFWMLRREGTAAAAQLAGAQQLRSASGGTVLQIMCETLLRTGRCRITKDRLTLFLRGFQKTIILERDELSCLPAALCAAVVMAAEQLYARLSAEAESDEDEAEAAHLFCSLRELSLTDLGKVIESADIVEQTLRADPAGIYPRMADSSRSHYRAALAELARRYGMTEHAAAHRILKLSEQAEREKERHVGWWLLIRPLGMEQKRNSGGGLIAFNILLTLFASLFIAFRFQSAAVFCILLLPVSELVSRTIDFILMRFTVPAHVPRLNLKNGIPPEGRTLCVICTLLTDAEGVREQVEALENVMLLNRSAGKELRCALLADYPDAAQAEPSAAELSALEKAAASVEALNIRYGGGFYLLTRDRCPNRDGRASGWERKRGALLETMRYLRGETSGIRAAAGDANALARTRYLLVLDADTQMHVGAAGELIGAMLHPLNAPVYRSDGLVTSGHGMLAPRLGVQLASTGQSDFSGIFAGRGGSDPYCSFCSELYMDRYGRSSFSGKGIIDIDAYLTCMGKRVPENMMLSHDAVEGSFLRCGYVGDTEFLDAFPGGVLSWLHRQERWIRGDWQNLPWLLSRRGSALPQLEKWKLFDSVRRSLVPVSTLAALIFGFFTSNSGIALAAAAAMLALLSELFVSLAESTLRSEEERGIRYRSALFVGIGGALVRTLLRLILLPAEAWFSLAAALRALWRMIVSKKKLLQWQTAAQSDRHARGLMRSARELWAAVALGAVLILLAPAVIGKAAGVLWLLSPLCAYLLSLPAAPQQEISGSERAYLRAAASDTWQYFDRFLTEENHWLPPDNVQERPPVGVAKRTSPTNIGLALLGIVSAMDLGILETAEGIARIERTIATLEALPKWHGHLYNWYSTETCTPLLPRYVSTVDSGNLCACLIALKNALLEYGAPRLAGRVGALAGAMIFTPLFDSERKLFYIGVETDTGEAGDAWYDLMASEARLTAYLAAARGDVPAESWRALSRALLQYHGYRGMASWTGTMFEYLMPELLLPLRRNSLLWESARYCLYVQQKRVRGLKKPWGVSESAYRALDSGMSYRYKAHGCAHLALKRGMDDELVISPYSSFLALAVRPHAAIRNLRRLEALGMRGSIGFWEALDYTPGRTVQGVPQIVYCVMAHHAGMSLIADANLLTGGRMQRRFLAEPSMRAYAGFLEEQVPVGGTVLKIAGDERRRPPQAISTTYSLSGSGTDFRRPQCCLLASQTYSLLVTESGITRPRWGALAPYLAPESPLDADKGIDIFVLRDGIACSLLPDAYGSQPGCFTWHFTTSAASVSADYGDFDALCSISVAENDVGELRHCVLHNRTDRPMELELYLRFRPLLARMADWNSHPAFCALGLSVREADGCLLIRRLARGQTRELWMCVAATRRCRFDLAPGADTGRLFRPHLAGDREYFLTKPLVTAVCDFTVEPNGSAEFDFSIALAYDMESALAGAKNILKSKTAADLPRAAAMVIGLDDTDVAAAYSLLPELVFPGMHAKPVARERLWAHGISGDYPIIAAHYESDDRLIAAKKLIDRHLFLCGCGCDFDLVFLTDDGGNYRRPLHTALGDALWRSGGEVLRGAEGGVHILERAQAASAVESAACILFPLSLPQPEPTRSTEWRTALPTALRTFSELSQVRYEWTKDAFRFYVSRSLPPRAWSCPLTNGRFGYLASDCGTGHLWDGNAREMQLSPWTGRPYAVSGPETILLQSGGTLASLFAAPGDESCAVSFEPGAAVWEKSVGRMRIRMTAFVPPETDARVIIIEGKPAPEAGAVLHWQMLLRMGENDFSAKNCRIAFRDGLAAVQPERGRCFILLSSGSVLDFTDSRSAALSLEYGGAHAPACEPAAALKLQHESVTVLVCGCDAPEKLRALASPAAANAALDETRRFWRQRLDRFLLNTSCPALDRIMNHWCAYQVLACRLYARCGIYQCGGAIGFRDQLQDAVSLILLDPAPARAQILRCCTHQYSEGDVQHWWHELGIHSKGVRTNCSDDLLWLPWAVCEYVEKTGDESVCSEQLPYLASPVLSPEENDRYEEALPGDVRENVFRHCIRAIRCVMQRGCGAHGLLRFGSGDWNDGLSAVRGESEWLSWFFLHTAKRFSALCRRLGTEWRELDDFSEKLCSAANGAWDGEWFLRGYYTDASPLGSSKNHECRIDSVAQSWAVLSGCAAPEKCRTAVSSAVRELFEKGADGCIRLFDPPFAGQEHPGYIESYGPGFRENGGQYTHAALWLIIALIRLGECDKAWELLLSLLPGEQRTERFGCEPYVLSADVYTAEGHEGEGGWSWYTGSAGWLLRAVTEEFLGLRLDSGKLYVEPHLPTELQGYSAVCCGHRIEVSEGSVRIDGQEWDGGGIMPSEDKSQNYHQKHLHISAMTGYTEKKE